MGLKIALRACEDLATCSPTHTSLRACLVAVPLVVVYLTGCSDNRLGMVRDDVVGKPCGKPQPGGGVSTLASVPEAAHAGPLCNSDCSAEVNTVAGLASQQ